MAMWPARLGAAFTVAVALSGCAAFQPSVTMPNFAGMPLSAAHDRWWKDMDQAISDNLVNSPGFTDASPDDRDQGNFDDWTVIAQYPLAGTVITEENTQVDLYVLRNEEAVWFEENPVMPAVPPGVVGTSLFDDGGVLEGMEDLTEFYYPEGTHPADTEFSGWRDKEYKVVPGDNRFLEPDAETATRAALARTDGLHSLTIGSLPEAGAQVRTGRLLIVTVQDKPRETPPPAEPGPESSGDSGLSVGGSVRGSWDDDDDDFNVPGWLCPTRFC